MMCTEFRDLSELLADGALAGAEARTALDHRAGCADCRAFEAECAVLLAPLHGFPPGPYLPPARPGSLPPWAGGPVFGVLLALLLAGGAGAWAFGGRGTSTQRVETEQALAPRPDRPPVGRPPAEIPAPARPDDADGVSLVGRVVTFPGHSPVAGVAISIDGVPTVTTDAAGVYRIPRLAPGGSRILRLSPPGGPRSDALLPFLAPGQVHSLADLSVGRPGTGTVRVLRMDARPEVGIRVRACRLAPTIHPELQPDWEPGPSGRVLPAMASALTGPEGTAFFSDLAPGTWTFQAEREGVPFSLPVDLEVGDDPEIEGTLLLEPGTTFEGRILDDATGAPVSGVLVRWTRIGLRTGSCDVRRQGAATTDAAGRFRFPAAPALPLFLEVVQPGATSPSGCLSVDASRINHADLSLPSVGVLAGTCVESGTGLPAAGALVRISVHFGDGMCPSNQTIFAKAGPDGRFEARGLPESALLQADLQPFASWCETGPSTGNLVRTGTPVRIEARRTAAIEGRVLDEEGRPAPGRPVIAMEMVEIGPGIQGMVRRAAQGFTDGDGRFHLENLVPGRASLHSPEAEDLSSPRIPAEANTAMAAAVPPPWVVAIPPRDGAGPVLRARAADPIGTGRSTERRGMRIRGRVLDLAGAPAPGTALRCLRGDLTRVLHQRDSSPALWIPIGDPVPVAEDGSFAIESPPAGSVTLVATSPRHPPSVAVVRPEAGREVDGFLLTLEEGLTLAGTVLREDGSPAAGVLLEAIPQGDARPSGNIVMVRARAAEDGTFRIDGLFRGPHTLHVGRWPGPVHQVPGVLPGASPIEVRLPPGDGVRPKPRDFHRPRVEPKEEELTSVLGGRIQGGSGRLSSVLAYDPFSPSHRCSKSLVDESGRFSCRVPPWRRFSLAAPSEDGRWVYADDLPAGSLDTVLRFDGPGTGLLRGRVVTAAGAAAAGVPVHAVRLRGEGETALPGEVLLEGRTWVDVGITDFLVPRFIRTNLTGSDGSFDLGSPPGRWVVFAGYPGTGEAASPAAVPWSAADPTVLEVLLGPGRVLRVAAVDDDAPPDARPLACAEVRLDAFLPGPDGPALTVRLPRPPGGVFEFRGLPPGPVTVRLADDRRNEVGHAAAEPGEERDPVVRVEVHR